MSWTAYPEYQQTGVSEIGEAPRNWGVVKLRHLLALNPSVPTALRNSTEEASFLPMELIGEDGSLDLSRSRPIGEVLSGYSYFAEGDVLFAKVTPCFENGKAALVRNLPTGHGFGTTEVTTMRPGPRLNQAFLGYLVRSDRFRQSGIAAMTGAGGLKRVPDQHVRDFPLALPPCQEQQDIVQFLDRETAKIDALITKQEQLIATLREDRTATITHAVTKGLDPDTAMAESGIEWLDLMPESWAVSSIANLRGPGLNAFTDGDWIETPYITDSGIRLIQTGNIGIGSYREQGFRYISDSTFDELRCKEVLPGDILICRLGDPVGRSCLAPDLGVRMITSVDVCILKPRDSHMGRYLNYVFNCQSYQGYVASLVRGSTRDRVSRKMLGRFVVPVPPPESVDAIVSYLDDKCDTIDQLIAKAERVIGTLREYRAALITDAVTGKIDVRGLA